MRRNARSAAERVQGQVRHSGGGTGRKSDPPIWVRPQLTELVKQPPDSPDWFHEIKYDGYRIHARIDGNDVRLLTRTGLDWTRKFLPIAAALEKLPVEKAYLDGELCGVRPDGTTSFSMIQAASDSGNADALVYFLFDLLFLDGEDLTRLPLSERKSRLAAVMSGIGPPLQYSDYLAAFSHTRIPVKWPDAAPNLEPRDDIWPTDRAPVIRRLENGTNAFSELRWSFHLPGPRVRLSSISVPRVGGSRSVGVW
jgi:ATP dependent DNA ligase domain